MIDDEFATLIAERRAASYRDGTLDMWTVYKDPKDYPDKYVARRFVLDQPTSDIIAADALESLRAPFLAVGFHCLMRAEADDPVIVEVWL